MATDRPIGMWEARNNPRSATTSSRSPRSASADGKGQGKAITMAKLGFNKQSNTLEIENYEREPVRLNEITIVK